MPMRQKLPPLSLLLFMVLCSSVMYGQDEDPYISMDIPSQNMLKFNRFLINPTFSTVKETKSYFNLYHRNEWDNSNKTYLGSYSGRINDRMGLGLSVYHQKFGVISNFGLMGNYTYGIRLGEKTKMYFGMNLSYYNSGFDQSEAQTVEIDPRLQELGGNSLFSVQPGINVSFDNFDVGFYAENLVDFNLDKGESATAFNEKTFSGHLMYTKAIEHGSGLMKDGRYSFLVRARKRGEDNVSPSASFILDLPVGWFQTGYDDYYGASAGVGFNISKRISVGYAYEKGLKNPISNFGSTHEINFAYSFQPKLTDNMVLNEEEKDNLLEERLASLKNDKEIEEGDEIVVENNTVTIYKSDEKAIADIISKERDNIMGSRDTSLEKRIMESEEHKRAYIQKYLKKLAENDSRKPEHQKRLNQLARELGIEPVENKSVADNEKAVKVAIAKPGVDYRPLATSRAVSGENKTYLLIANVFKEGENLDKFLAQMKEKGINAKTLTKNGLHYVYLNEYKNWGDAAVASSTGLNGKYNEEMWIMGEQTTEENSKEAYDFGRNRWTNLGLTECTKENIEKLNATTFAGFRGNGSPGVMMENTVMHNGYYIIANVFSEHKNASRFMTQLKSQGINAYCFVNPKNNYSYVYLNKETSWQNANTIYKENVHKEDLDLWIMHIKT